MPADKVFTKFKAGKLHSGSKHGAVVHNRKQAIAIYLSEKRNEDETGDADERPKRGPKPKRR